MLANSVEIDDLPVVLTSLADGKSVPFCDILGPFTVAWAYCGSISLRNGVKALPELGFCRLLQLPSNDLMVSLSFELQSGTSFIQSHCSAISVEVSALKYLPSKFGSPDKSWKKNGWFTNLNVFYDSLLTNWIKIIKEK